MGRRLRNGGKKNVLGILVDSIDYEATLEFVFDAARRRQGAAISALAVHGVMTGAFNPEHRYRLNHFDLIVPDGQPVRWVLNYLYQADLADRVYGPTLTLKVCERAANEGASIYLYGSTLATLTSLEASLVRRFPKLTIAGVEPSKFGRLTSDEKDEVAKRVESSGASIVLLGLGCPRQEIFAFEFRDVLPMPIIAVGAAFPFIAGLIPQAPAWMQARGLEWLFRLSREPRRLWRRYIYLNPTYLILVALQAANILRFSTTGFSPAREELFG